MRDRIERDVRQIRSNSDFLTNLIQLVLFVWLLTWIGCPFI